MPHALIEAIAALFVLDVLVRPWEPIREHAAGNAIYLAIAYAPMLAMPFLDAWGVTVVVGAFALFSHWNFSRMVGLTSEPRFFMASFLCTAAFFVVARVHWYALFQAMPAFAVCFVIAAGAIVGDARAFLQRLCLAWVALLVYGYLGAHAALYAELHTVPVGIPGGLLVAYVLFLAKCGDWLWSLSRRLAPEKKWLQLVLSPLGGALGGALLARLHIENRVQLIELGALVGAALGFASRAFGLIATDVIGEKPGRPLKGTALFGVAFALAVAYHFIRYFWTP